MTILEIPLLEVNNSLFPQQRTAGMLKAYVWAPGGDNNPNQLKAAFNRPTFYAVVYLLQGALRAFIEAASLTSTKVRP